MTTIDGGGSDHLLVDDNDFGDPITEEDMMGSGGGGDDDAGTFMTQDGEQDDDDAAAFGYEHTEFPDDIQFDDPANVSQSTRLHKKMREMKELDAKLAAMKDDYNTRIKIVKKGEQRFLERQKNTIEYLRKFKGYIVETDNKRNRALQKADEERRQVIKKTQEVKALQAHLKSLRKKWAKMERKYEKFKQNQTYMDMVVTNNDQYTEIDELITRYKILEDTNNDLRAESASVATRIEEFQLNLQSLLKDKQNQLLVKNSVLACKLKELEDVTDEASAVANEVESIETKHNQSSRKFGEVQMAIRNIHARAMASYPSRRKNRILLKDSDKEKSKRNAGNLSSWGNDSASVKAREEQIEEDNAALLAELCLLLDQTSDRLKDMDYIVLKTGQQGASQPELRTSYVPAAVQVKRGKHGQRYGGKRYGGAPRHQRNSNKRSGGGSSQMSYSQSSSSIRQSPNRRGSRYTQSGSTSAQVSRGSAAVDDRIGSSSGSRRTSGTVSGANSRRNTVLASDSSGSGGSGGATIGRSSVSSPETADDI